jgi:hypothetical protein
LHNRRAWTTGVITDSNGFDHLVLKGWEFLILAFPLNEVVLRRGPPSCKQAVVPFPTHLSNIYGVVYKVYVPYAGSS